MTAAENVPRVDRDGHVLMELGFGLERVGGELHGSARVVPEMYVPGTESLRLSVLAIWADTAAGWSLMPQFAPRVPVTLELSVHAYRPLREHEEIVAVARVIKSGRSVAAVTIDFSGSQGDPVAVAATSFMAAPNPDTLMPAEVLELDSLERKAGRLTTPLAERAGLSVREPGVAVLPRTDQGLNASGTVNGGLIALAVEEAALSTGAGDTLADLGLRYLRPVRVGPAVATATVRDGLGSVEVRDTGADDKLAVLGTTRIFDAL